MSGIPTTQGLIDVYNQSQMKTSTTAFVIYKVDAKNIVVDTTVDLSEVESILASDEAKDFKKAPYETDSYACLRYYLTKGDAPPRYATIKLKYSFQPGHEGKKTVFIAWMRDDGPWSQRMLAASSKDALIKALEGLDASIEANDESDLDFKKIAKVVGKDRVVKFVEVEGILASDEANNFKKVAKRGLPVQQAMSLAAAKQVVIGFFQGLSWFIDAFDEIELDFKAVAKIVSEGDANVDIQCLSFTEGNLLELSINLFVKMALSGITVAQGLIDVYNQFKKNTAVTAFVIYKIDGKNIVVDTSVDFSEVEGILASDEAKDFKKAPYETDSYACLRYYLTKGDASARYATIKLKYNSKSGHEGEKIVFITWVRDDGPVRQRMLAASSKDTLIKAFEGLNATIQANDESDLDFKEIAKVASKGDAVF
eukprot:gene19960-21914_t